ncbi:unnamed protein product [Prorocentrum cordatum]|uniref:Uncharacterized protein n=1 Tax=Prorocentrum cordatum TaxID=2364126 RepID=A0ABN9Y3Z4_9DINO|nr:unnamed protein product [Polarella glacialis]
MPPAPGPLCPRSQLLCALAAFCMLAAPTALLLALAYSLPAAGAAAELAWELSTSLQSEVAVCVGFFFASLTQGILGFGFGIVSMAILPYALPLMEVVPVVGVEGLAVTMLVLIQVFTEVDRQALVAVAPLLLGELGGVPLGSKMLQWVDTAWLRLLLGVTMVAFSVYQLIEGRRAPGAGPEPGPGSHGARPARPALALAVGLLSGVLGGCLSEGGPPVVAFLASQGWSKGRTKGTIQCFFFCLTWYTLAVQASVGIPEGQRRRHAHKLVFLQSFVQADRGPRVNFMDRR